MLVLVLEELVDDEVEDEVEVDEEVEVDVLDDVVVEEDVVVHVNWSADSFPNSAIIGILYHGYLAVFRDNYSDRVEAKRLFLHQFPEDLALVSDWFYPGGVARHDGSRFHGRRCSWGSERAIKVRAHVGKRHRATGVRFRLQTYVAACGVR